jgi:hypothetical protein
MLVTNPNARATLPEVLNHVWMCRGFNGPPDPHLLHREPLRIDELDPKVIHGMAGFEFGSDENIERKLVRILESDTYQRAVQAYERRRDPGSASVSRNGHTLPMGRWTESLSTISYDGSNPQSRTESQTSPKKSKRFSGFDYYRRKLFLSGSSPPGTPPSQSPSNSQSQLASPEMIPDPAKGFHPLLSMYYLAREKLERERLYGPGHFASSQLSLQQEAAAVAAPPSSSAAPSADASSQPPPYATMSRHPPPSKTGKDKEPAARTDYTMFVPRVPAPETSHYSGMSYDAQTQQPATSASPTTQTFHPQPRPRDAGGLAVTNHQGQMAGASAPTTPTKAGLPRAPPASTHRRSHSLSQRPSGLRGIGGMFGGGDVDAIGYDVHAPRSAAPALGTFPERHERENEKVVVENEKVVVENEKVDAADADAPPVVVVDEKNKVRQEKDKERQEAPSRVETSAPPSSYRMSTPPMSAGATLVRRFGSMLVGKGDDGKRHGTINKRATILGLSPRPPEPQESEKDMAELVREKEQEERKGKQQGGSGSGGRAPSPKSTVRESTSQPLHRRAATILDPHGRAARHERRSSTGATLFATGAIATLGRARRPSTASNSPFFGRAFSKTEEVEENPEENATDVAVNGVNGVNGQGAGGFREEGERHTSEKDFKPVFLKGLFRYVTDRVGSS